MYTLYGIKNCDTVKKARLWLDQNNIAYRFHDYRTDGLTLQQLNNFAARADWNLLLNRSSTSWRQLDGDQQNNLTQDKAIQLMLNTPTLIKRPILESDDKLIIGFNAKAGGYTEILPGTGATKANDDPTEL
ncbi:MAG: ArsC family reductase [Methylococcaceae bacterium]